MARNVQRLAASVKRRRESRPGIGGRDVSDEGRGRIALVTGASSGMGWSMAELLAAKGYDLVVVARREARLKELQNELESTWQVRVHPLPCDLSDPGAATYIRDQLADRGLPIDFLVNNAGYTITGSYTEHSWGEHLRLVRVMGLTVAELCHHFLPHMVEQRWGRIINVTSIAGSFPGSPGMTLYSATKSFVHKFTEGLAAEYEDFGIHCTVSVPGMTDTDFMKSVADYVANNLSMQLAMMRPEVVTRQAYRACMNGRRVVVHGPHHKAWAFLLVHSPPALRYALVRFVAKMDPARQAELAAAKS